MKYVAGKEPPAVRDRPKCPCCGKRLTPIITSVSLGHAGNWKRVDHQWIGTYRSYGAFCTLRCCETFANAAHKAGYRLRTL